MERKRKFLSKLPKVDETLRDQRLFEFFEDTPRELIVESVREIIKEEREDILRSCGQDLSFDEDRLMERICDLIKKKRQLSLRQVVNATGVTLHTNLGRAVLSSSACSNIIRVAKGYSNLEYNIKKGARGSRHSHVESMICRITGAEAAMVVNNNAAATMLCLSTLAEGREVIVSRGELVEIGGSFRIPDIMEQSGARLIEAGATNKTKASDYHDAISEDTAALLKVHTSNYRIIGFTAEVSIEELASIAKEKGIPVIYDMGSGLIVDLSRYGIKEPTVSDGLRAGADVILFSGDKLMGGPQAGIIAGKKEYINRMKKHPLARAFRIDKLTLAALEATMREYLDPEKAMREIPTLRMLTEDKGAMERRGRELVKKLEPMELYRGEVAPATEQAGGGSAPATELEGICVKLKSDVPAEKTERLLRKCEVPVIARIVKDEICLDMRTVSDDDIELICGALEYAERELSGRYGE